MRARPLAGWAGPGATGHGGPAGGSALREPLRVRRECAAPGPAVQLSTPVPGPRRLVPAGSTRRLLSTPVCLPASASEKLKLKRNSRAGGPGLSRPTRRGPAPGPGPNSLKLASDGHRDGLRSPAGPAGGARLSRSGRVSGRPAAKSVSERSRPPSAARPPAPDVRSLARQLPASAGAGEGPPSFPSSGDARL
jgi:hypothetical protein